LTSDCPKSLFPFRLFVLTDLDARGRFPCRRLSRGFLALGFQPCGLGTSCRLTSSLLPPRLQHGHLLSHGFLAFGFQPCGLGTSCRLTSSFLPLGLQQSNLLSRGFLALGFPPCGLGTI
jgi:hypothetical protein